MNAPPVPRFWWLKRIAAAAVVLTAVLGGLLAWYLHEIDRREQALYARLGWHGQAGVAGPPIRPSRIDGDDNPAAWVLRAIDLMPQPAGAYAERLDRRSVTTRLTPAEAEEVAGDFEDVHAETLSAVRTGRELRDAGAEVDFAGRLAKDYPPLLNERRQLAQAVVTAAEISHARGDVSAALASLRDAEFLADAAARDYACVVSSVIASGMHAMAASRAWDFARDSSSDPESWRAARVETEALIARLLDVRTDRALITLAFRGEPATTYTALAYPWRNVPVSPLVTEPIRPMMRLAAARMATFYADLHDLAAASSTVWPLIDHVTDVEAVRERSDVPQGLRYMLLPNGVVYRTTERVLLSFADAGAQRSLAATALAASLYRLDHGTLPATLDDLVPAYLPRVPVDPLCRDGGPLRYLPDAALPVIYSVGTDGVDDGGSAEPNGLRPRIGPTGRLDLVIPLAPAPGDVDPWEYLLAEAQPDRVPVDDEQRQPDDEEGE